MALRAVAEVAPPPALTQFQQDRDPTWIDAALAATGTATLRRRRTRVERVIWLLLGMALYRDRSMVEVAAALDLALPVARGPVAAPRAATEARPRLGTEPLAWLFAHCAEPWAHTQADADRWRGLALYGLDGATLRAADSATNRDHFGGQSAGGARGRSGYPLLRLVALMALRSHVRAAAAFGPYAHGEGHYAVEPWPQVPDDTLTIVDRNFLAAGMLLPVAAGGTNRHCGLVRAKAKTRTTLVTELGPRSWSCAAATGRAAPTRRCRAPSARGPSPTSTRASGPPHPHRTLERLTAASSGRAADGFPWGGHQRS